MSIDVNVQNDLVIVTESSEDIVVNVSNAAGPAGPAGVGVPVGGSTGQVLKKLSATNYDTYWALDGGGVPYSGATGDVDLGEYELKAGQVEFDQTPTGAIGAAVMRWNDSDGTVDLGLKGGNVTLQVGQEQVLRVVNKTGADLLESQYRAVRIRLVSEGGSQGQRLAVVLAQGDNDPDSTTTIGIVTENIDNNQEGFITTSGEVRGINTTGSLQSETWLDGDIIYLSPTIPGGITKVKPTAPQHLLQLGYVIYAHNVNGKIFVKIDNGYELSELHDVYAPSPTDGQGIFWNTANLRYQNNTVAGILGYTPVPTTRTLTINGTAFDLSADRSWTVGATPAGSNTQIQYNNSGAFGASANLVWDNDNTKLNIGTNAGSIINATNVNVVGSGTLAGVTIKNTTTTNAQTGFYLLNSNNDYCQLFKASRTYTTYKTIVSGDFGLYNAESGDIVLLNDFATGKIKFAAGGVSTAQMTLTTAGRLLLGTTDESTYLLDVNGTARVSGVLTCRATLSNSTTDTDYAISLNGITSTDTTTRILINSGTLNATGILYGAQALNATVNNYGVGTFINVNGDSSIGHVATTGANSLSINGFAVRTNGQTGAGSIGYTWINGNSRYFYHSIFVSGELKLWNKTGDIYYVRDWDTTNITFGSSTHYASAQVTIDSTTKGFLPPRLTTTEKNAIASPATGLQVYDTTLNAVSVYDGATWRNDTDTVTTNRQAASYTLALADRGKLVEMNVATANNLTVPLNSSIAFPIGTKIDISQYGAGQTTVVATGGVTVRSAGGALKLAAQYSGASLVKIGTDEWYLFGDITV